MPDLQEYLRMFADLNVGGGRKPHKPCLLLAVIDLVESGSITNGLVQLNPALREAFSEYFTIVAKPDDKNRPDNPFRYLNKPFWTLKGEGYTKAEITSELFKYMQSASNREAMREQLIREWFPDHQEALSEKLAFRRDSNSYERALREAVASEPVVSEALPVRNVRDKKVRDSAFRRLVLEAYDYRCAASGWRLIVPESRILVQAAHLIPHSESQDDDPRNGIALTPNFHWALDQHIIAPGPDMKWHVSEVVDKRIPDNQPLIELEGKAVNPPTKRSMSPRKDVLEWRLERLLPAA